MVVLVEVVVAMTGVLRITGFVRGVRFLFIVDDVAIVDDDDSDLWDLVKVSTGKETDDFTIVDVDGSIS